MRFLTTVIFILSSTALAGQQIDKNKYEIYSYKDAKTSHIVKVFFVNRTKILFKMSLLNKKTGQLCELSGEARTEPGGGLEAATDENGNGYLAISFNYYKGPLFISFQFEDDKNLQRSRKLQIGSTNSGKVDHCDYNSSYYILSKYK